MLLVGAAACTSRGPRVGVEAVLAETGLPSELIKAAPASAGEPKLIVDEAARLFERFEAGEFDLVLVNDDLRSDAALRQGSAGAATPIFHQEVVLVGPKEDPVGIHAERSLEGALRTIIEGGGTFFHCRACGARAREEAIFATVRGLPPRGSAFIDVGPGEADVVKAMRGSPGHGFLARPTVLKLMKDQEWSFKPMWSGDALQVDTYRLLSPPEAKLAPERREAVLALRTFLLSEAAKAQVAKFGVEAYGQPLYRPGAPPIGEGVRF